MTISTEQFLPDGDKYLSADDFERKHGKDMVPPKGGWKHGSRVMCAMRNKNTNAYFPRVQCYVHISDRIYLIQKHMPGSIPRDWPAEFPRSEYTAWTIGDGTSKDMLWEQVALLCREGRNAL